MSVRILVGDARERLAELADESVHCVVTSPPYWGLRSYEGDPGMIGMEPTFDEHVENLLAVFREVHRVLRSDGTLWLNYGDAYAANWSSRGDNRGGGFRDEEGRTRLKRTPGNWKQKDLLMMPSRVAMALQSDGAVDQRALDIIDRTMDMIRQEDTNGIYLAPAVARVYKQLQDEYAEAKGKSRWLRSELIFHKKNPMPESVTDRPTNAHEKLFLLSKRARYFYDADAVRIPMAYKSIRRSKDETAPYIAAPDRQESWKPMEYPADGRANLRNVWSMATATYKGAHFAVMPETLVETCVKAGTSEKGVCSNCGAPYERIVETPKIPDEMRNREGVKMEYHTRNPGGGQAIQDWREQNPPRTVGWEPTCTCRQPDFGSPYKPKPATILDPFGGSGTVGLVADRLQRDAIIVEINEKYAKMAEERIRGDAPMFVDVEVKGA